MASSYALLTTEAMRSNRLKQLPKQTNSKAPKRAGQIPILSLRVSLNTLFIPLLYVCVCWVKIHEELAIFFSPISTSIPHPRLIRDNKSKHKYLDLAERIQKEIIPKVGPIWIDLEAQAMVQLPNLHPATNLQRNQN